MTSELVFAIGDIHGRSDLLRAALEAIAARCERRDHRLVFLGDYVDRGPDAKGVVELMIELQRDSRIVCLKGNHEALMVEALTSGRAADFDRWMDAGGLSTLKSYGASDREEAVRAVPPHHLRWMATLPLTSGDGRRVYVHAGLLPDTPLERQTEQTCLWVRERFLRASPRHFDTHVVHGHSPAWNEERQTCDPELLSHRTNLDLATYWTNRLGVGVFDSEKAGGPIEVLIAHGVCGARASVSTLTPPTDQDAADCGAKRKRGWVSPWRSLAKRRTG
jgi:serine/threonine protein phosphatase 1